MTRFFNTAGPCQPDVHYALPPERRLPELEKLIDRRSYFVVHAPRQSGKTTLFRALAARLRAQGRYAAVHASCESGQTARGDVDRGVQSVLRSIAAQAEGLPEPQRPEAIASFASIEGEYRLRSYLTAWSRRSSLPVVLFLDEIDALQDETLVATLRQLRDGYPDRPDQFPLAVALIGLRDVRDYQVRLDGKSETLGTASPFNVKVESLTLRNFTAAEVAELYLQHTAETGQRWSDEALARAFLLTRGQPWLVNALAREAVEKVVPDPRQEIDLAAIEKAKEALILRRDTHLDSLVARLRENRVRKVLEPILSGQLVEPDVYDDDLQFVVDLGLVTRGPNGLEIANPIYREVLPRVLAGLLESILPPIERSRFVKPGGELHFEALLDEFRAFWCEHAEFFLKRQPYSEAAAELIFMAFLQRIVNGGGTIEREYGVGSGRIDLLVTWPATAGKQRLAVELKVWRDEQNDPLQKGLAQLDGYLGRLGLDHGTLILFDRRKSAPPLPGRCSRESLDFGGRRITVERL